MSTEKSPFADDPLTPGIGWMAKCVAMAAIIGAGTFFGQLQNTCIALLTGFTVIRGIMPFLSSMLELRTDQGHCAEEQEAIAEIPVENREHVNALAEEEDKSGRVFELVIWILASRDRMSPKTAVDVFLTRFDTYWENRLSVLDEAADQAPVLGLGGSLLGLAAGLQTFSASSREATPGNPGVLFEALSTMCLTTLAGCGAYMIIAGLSRLAHNAVANHRAALKTIGNEFSSDSEETNAEDDDEESPDDDDDLFDLIRGAA